MFNSVLQQLCGVNTIKPCANAPCHYVNLEITQFGTCVQVTLFREVGPLVSTESVKVYCLSHSDGSNLLQQPFRNYQVEDRFLKEAVEGKMFLSGLMGNKSLVVHWKRTRIFP